MDVDWAVRRLFPCLDELRPDADTSRACRSIIVAVLYLYLHYQNTIDRRRSLWLVRLVDRPSGRFVVIK